MKSIVYFAVLLLLPACQGNRQNAKGRKTNTTSDSAQQTLNAFFEEINVVKMHIFATADENPQPESYQYAGKPIQAEALKVLSEDLQAGGNVFATYRTENNNFYILRLANNNPRGVLVLAKWDADAGKLKKLADLAFLDCNENGCKQQDAWLIDLDDNRNLELIIRSGFQNKDGTWTQDAFTVMEQDQQGNFVKSSDLLASLALKENYNLRNLTMR